MQNDIQPQTTFACSSPGVCTCEVTENSKYTVNDYFSVSEIPAKRRQVCYK